MAFRNHFTRYLLAAVGVVTVMACFMALLMPLPTHAQVSTPTPNQGTNLPSGLQVNIAFTDLTFSTSNVGPAMSYFPTGTPEIFVRFNYYNVPQGTSLLRQWYRDGQLAIQKEDRWSPAWGSSGRLTHISIYDYINGLTPGYYHLLVSLRGYPAAQITGDFVIADNPVTIVPPGKTPGFTNLTVSNSPGGPAMTAFPAGTPVVSARWDYANILVSEITLVQRNWYLNGVLFRSVADTWEPNWASSGRLTHIALYDYQNGLPSGTYRLVVSLLNMPAVHAETNFTIGDSVGGVLSHLTFSNTPNGPDTALFLRGTQQVFARWDYNNVPQGLTVIRRWYHNGVLWLERREPWTLVGTGTVQNISIYDFTSPAGLLPGDYFVQIILDGLPQTLISGYFTIR